MQDARDKGGGGGRSSAQRAAAQRRAAAAGAAGGATTTTSSNSPGGGRRDSGAGARAGELPGRAVSPAQAVKYRTYSKGPDPLATAKVCCVCGFVL